MVFEVPYNDMQYFLTDSLPIKLLISIYLQMGHRNIDQTSNMTGCHRGPKQKLRAGYRAPSL